MPKAVLIENDLAKTLMTKCKPRGLKFNKKLMCSLFLDLDLDAYMALDDDPLLLAKVTEAASTRYYDLVNALTIDLRMADAAVMRTDRRSERNDIAERFQKDAKRQLKVFSKDGARAAELAWAKVAKTKSDYKTYQVKAGVALAIDGLSLVAGVASTVGSGGFALVVGIYGIVKGLVGAATKIYKLALDADKMQGRVTKGLKKIQKSFNAQKKELSGAKDTGKAFVNQMLGADFVPTISTVKADNDQYKSKLQGVGVNSHKLAKELNAVLKEMDKVSRMPEVKSSQKVAKLLDKLQNSTATLIDKVVDLQSKVNDGMVFQKNTAAAIKELESFQPKKWKAIQKGLVVTDIVLAGGDFSKAGDAALTVGAALVAEVDRELLDHV